MHEGGATADHAAKERAARARRVEALDGFAAERDRWRTKNAFYYRSIEELARFVVPEGARVLEIGCGTGELLAALRPSAGVGVDIAPRMIAAAQQKYRAARPELVFLVDDAEQLAAPELGGQTFDYIVMSDVVGQLFDVWAAFRTLRRFAHPRTRILVTYYNFVWEPVLRLGEKVGLKMPVPQQNWLGMPDLKNLLELAHLDVIRSGTANLVPRHIPVVARFANRYLARAPLLRHFALTQFFVARLAQGGGPIPERDYSCTVVVPCKNERGNVDAIVARTPQMGRSTELLFVDGSSDDGTVAAIEPHLARPWVKLIHQGAGKGKGDAVRKGFAAATGDLLFILDADLTVPPEDLPKFYAAIAEGKGEFINGSRLVYPMEGEAMRFLNLLGNKFFGAALSGILEQRLKDTLCGTKVLLRRDYQRIADGRRFFGDFDPFGDFDLIFGAAKQNLKIVEMPIRYRDRTYGETKISRFRNGITLVRMTLHAWRKFKLAY
ncbi:MAG: glycosyltransferase [Myxococcales bacterium]|nr:glycosyltransferase [Myxococcales bacterium]